MIIQNAIKITENPKRPVYLKSSHRHDFQSYYFSNAKSISVDGGTDYIRRVGDQNLPYEEFCLDSKDSLAKIRNKLLWGGRGKNGDQPLTYKPIKDLPISHLRAIIENVQGICPIHKAVIEYWIGRKYWKNKLARLVKP